VALNSTNTSRHTPAHTWWHYLLTSSVRKMELVHAVGSYFLWLWFIKWVSNIVILVCTLFLMRLGWVTPKRGCLLFASILRISQMIWVWRATVEWNIDGEDRRTWRKTVPVSLCPPQIPHGLTRARTRASVGRGRLLTTWAMARPIYNLNLEQVFQTFCSLSPPP
jgi:hypothetical protein